MSGSAVDITRGAPLNGLHGWFLGRWQRLCNRCIEESSAAAERVLELEGRSLAVHIEGLGIAVVVTARNGQVLLSTVTGEPASATLRGAPLDLVRLLPTSGQRSLAARLKATRAELAGKVEVAEKFAEVFRLARPDLEEELARWIGDITAHEIGRAATGVGEWLGRAAEALRLDAAEFLQEETRTFPTRLETRAFGAEVERLRDDVERAAQRVERLARADGSR